MTYTTLKELEIGERFVPQNGKYPPFKVIGKPEFNIRHGSATRICFNERSRRNESKSCRLRVIKLPM